MPLDGVNWRRNSTRSEVVPCMMCQADHQPDGIVRLRPPSKHYVMRALKFLLAGIGVAAIGVEANAVHSTYEQCLSAEQDLWVSYISYGPAIYGRLLNISIDIYSAKSINELRTLIAKLPREEAFKDKTLLELELGYNHVLEQMDLENTSKYAELYKAAEEEMRSQPGYDRLVRVFSGEVPDDLTDADLSQLQRLAAYVSRMYIDYFFRPFRTIYVNGCTIADIIKLELGGRPKILRAKLTTFTEFAQDRLNKLKSNPPAACVPPCVPNL